MRPFEYVRPSEAAEAIRARGVAGADTAYLAGGTTLLDLMKLDVIHPAQLVDITRIQGKAYRKVERTDAGLRIGALVSMAELAANEILLKDYPVLSQSLWLAASAQLRNMARVGGNVLQRTRCSYFRDTSYTECNKRTPGSGCAALDGFHRGHAVLGTSDQCIAMYPGDWAQALIALDALVEVLGANGPRSLRFADLHRLPGNTPNIENNLKPGELITGFVIPGGAWRRSLYRKIQIPQEFTNPMEPRTVSPDEVMRAFLDANPGLKPDMLAISCGGSGNRLQEIRFCFSKEGQPRACGQNENQRRMCSAQKMYLPPVRSTKAGPDTPADRARATPPQRPRVIH